MQDLLSRIIEMDERARRIHEQAQREKEISEDEIEIMRQQIYDEYITRAKERVEEKLASIRKEAQTQYAQEQRCAAELTEQMRQRYAENGDRWVEEIVDRVISR